MAIAATIPGNRIAYRRLSLIAQQSFGRSINLEYRLNLPPAQALQGVDLSPLSPPTRLSDSATDFNRHLNFFRQCLAAADGTTPLLLTKQHVFSLAFYRAIAEASGESNAIIISLDAHLDALNLDYSNWAFWSFGIEQGLIKPDNLYVVGSFQAARAREFVDKYDCAAAISNFNYEPISQYREFLDRAAQLAVQANPAVSAQDLRSDPLLRDFAEYALLKNAGARIVPNLTGLDLAGQPIFVSLDTDVGLADEALLVLAEQLSSARVLGLHLCELDAGLGLHERTTLERFVETVLGPAAPLQ